jgi:hypothetical protein
MLCVCRRLVISTIQAEGANKKSAIKKAPTVAVLGAAATAIPGLTAVSKSGVGWASLTEPTVERQGAGQGKAERNKADLRRNKSEVGAGGGAASEVPVTQRSQRRGKSLGGFVSETNQAPRPLEVAV